MSLPVIETPRYSCTLPVTEKLINYRPFLVGEQKTLLMHQEGDDPTMLSKDTLRLMQACICDDDVFVNTLPMADVEYLFLQVRIKSAGETVDVQIECSECKEFNDDVNESTYVYTVSNLASNPRHTTGLTFKAKFIKPVKLVGKEHSVLGSDPFNCDYLIPLENENG